MGLVTLSFAISVVVNLVYVALDPPWVKQLGDTFTTAVAFYVMLQLLQVFPFAAAWAAWHSVFRVFLVLGCVGAAIGVIANIVKRAQGASRGLDAR